MKWFYPVAAVMSAALFLSPMLFLEGAPADEYAGKSVLWNSYGSQVRSLDPATCGDTTSSGIQGNIFEGLYTYHFLKRPVEVEPDLADGMPEVSEDGLTYTIRILPGVKYHRNSCFGPDANDPARPGTRTVRAEDFVLAFQRIADYHMNSQLAWALVSGRIRGLDEYHKKTAGYKSGDFSRYDLPVEGLEAVDELTLRLTLTEPFPQFIYVLAMHLYAPIPREAVDYWLAAGGTGEPLPMAERSVSFREARQLAGTGAYVLKTFERKKRIVLERNEDYREVLYPSEGTEEDRAEGLLDDAGKRVPFIDIVHMDFVPEDYSAWMRFLTKQADLSGIPRETFEFVITPDKDLSDRWRQRHIYLKKYSSPAVFWIAFNMEDPVIGGSKSLRQAMCLSFDVENYVKVLYNSRGKRAVNIIPSTFQGHAEAGPGPYYRLDRQAAKAKLEEAKKELAAKGLLKNGKIPELTIDLPDTDGPAVRMGEFFKQQFSAIGLKVKISLNDWPTLQEKVHNKATQIYTMGWHADYPDAENFLQLFYTPNIAKGTNNTNYSNPRFDRWYETIRVMPPGPERMELYVKMIRQISEDVPVLLLSEPQSFLLAYDWVHNVKPHPIGYGYTKYRRIDAELRRKLGGR